MLSQSAIAEHLDMSQQAVSQLMDQLSIDWRNAELEDIRIAYIRRLRKQAAGRAASGDLDLAGERAGLARAQRDRIEMQNAVTRGELAPVVLISDACTIAITAMSPEEKLEFIEQAASAMAAGCPVPMAAAAWLGAALRAYLSRECLDITRSLGLRPRRGGAFETPHALVRYRERDTLIRFIADLVPGKNKGTACLKVIFGEARLDDPQVAEAVAKLRSEFASELPSSAKTYSRILKGEAVHYRR